MGIRSSAHLQSQLINRFSLFRAFSSILRLGNSFFTAEFTEGTTSLFLHSKNCVCCFKETASLRQSLLKEQLAFSSILRIVFVVSRKQLHYGRVYWRNNEPGRTWKGSFVHHFRALSRTLNGKRWKRRTSSNGPGIAIVSGTVTLGVQSSAKLRVSADFIYQHARCSAAIALWMGSVVAGLRDTSKTCSTGW